MENNMSYAKPQFSLTELLVLTRRLTQLVIEEASLLKQMKVSEVASIQIEKNAVATVLEKQQKLLRENAELRASLTDSDKAALKEVAVEFDSAIQNYQRELFKARKVNELVIGKMVDALQEHVNKNRAYNKNGNKSMDGTELANNTPAIKFNAQV